MHFPLHSVHAVHSDKTQSGGHDLKQSSISDVSNIFDTDNGSEIVDNKLADSKIVDKHFSVDSFELSFPAPDRSQVTFRRATPMPHSAPCNENNFLLILLIFFFQFTNKDAGITWCIFLHTQFTKFFKKIFWIFNKINFYVRIL